jgi:putative ABC transport system ATP-binding protein
VIRALVQTPAFLLLDEPTGPLDAAATAATERLLRQRLDAGAGIILITHDADQADRLSDNALTLDNGKADGGAA